VSVRPLATLSGVALLSLAAPGKPAPGVVTIVVDKLAFGPAPRGLKVGDVVQWVNRDIFQHSATARDKSFDVELPPGGQGRTVLRRAGKIAYVCRYHPGMTGVLEVRR
jgi:plastocyanin